MGNKNKKSKLRKININNKEYFWIVNSPNCDGDGNCLICIWYNKKQIFKDIIPYGETMTPVKVKDIILNLN